MTINRTKFTFTSSLQAHTTAMVEARKAGLNEIGLLWQLHATRLTPVDSGFLRASLAFAAEGSKQHQESAVGQDGAINGEVAYEASAPANTVRLGSNQDYAIPVHEDLNAHRRSGQAKFIEIPLQEHGPAWVELLARRLREAAGG